MQNVDISVGNEKKKKIVFSFVIPQGFFLFYAFSL